MLASEAHVDRTNLEAIHPQSGAPVWVVEAIT